MRSVLRLAIAGLVGMAGLVTPVVAPLPHALAAAPPKVVVIVGPVGSQTASYRAEGDAAATAAAKYTPNVVKIYTPNATWAAVKPALQGASIVIYFGHGNGFPSPYLKTLTRDRQDGLGLNPVDGANDTATQYWGEQYLASDVRLAPNAVVLLGHLCYASGSSEPGHAAPTLDVAKQRVDNFAAGFLAAGAAAVFADAHGRAVAQYVDAIFSTHQSLGQLWAAAPSSQGHAFSFPSTRTPGMTAQMDPDTSSGGYYRSIVGKLDLQTDSVLGSAGTTATGGTSGGTSSGGSSSAGPAPAEPSPSPGQGATAPQGPEVVSTGPASPTTIDTIAPAFGATGSGAGTATADSSGNADRWVGTFKVSESGRIDATVANIYGTPIRHFSVAATAGTTSVGWDWSADGGGPAADGQYVITLVARDAAGNPSPQVAVLVSVFRALSKVIASKSLFYPQDGDAYAPSIRLSFRLAVPATVTWTISDSAGAPVYTRYLDAAMPAGTLAWTWAGLDQTGKPIAPGRYSATIAATNGTLRASATVPLTVAAFSITTGPTSAVRGKSLTVTAVSAEPLSGSPGLTVAQPGGAIRTAVMTQVDTNTYRATVKLSSSGASGSVTLQVSGTDLRGGSNVATGSVALK